MKYKKFKDLCLGEKFYTGIGSGIGSKWDKPMILYYIKIDGQKARCYEVEGYDNNFIGRVKYFDHEFIVNQVGEKCMGS
jgi:hypothetical protein